MEVLDLQRTKYRYFKNCAMFSLGSPPLLIFAVLRHIHIQVVSEICIFESRSSGRNGALGRDRKHMHNAYNNTYAGISASGNSVRLRERERGRKRDIYILNWIESALMSFANDCSSWVDSTRNSHFIISIIYRNS